MSKEKTPNPFNNHGASYDAWQSGYNSDPELTDEVNPYATEAGDLHQYWIDGRLAKTNDIAVIPSGLYCHGELHPETRSDGQIVFKAPKMCPYWRRKEGRTQENGYCAFMEKGDGDIVSETLKDGTINTYEVDLLWDQCKGCGIKNDSEE
jgi:hypothetical protein